MEGEAKKENPAAEKSFSFALRIVKLYQYLPEKKKEFILSKQLLRAGTSIGANLVEGVGTQSPADFFKVSSLKSPVARGGTQSEKTQRKSQASSRKSQETQSEKTRPAFPARAFSGLAEKTLLMFPARAGE